MSTKLWIYVPGGLLADGFAALTMDLPARVCSIASTAYPVAASLMKRPSSLSGLRRPFNEGAHQLPSWY